MNEAQLPQTHVEHSPRHRTLWESKLLERVPATRESVDKNKRICMHILICASIHFGNKREGLVTKAAFQEGNGGWGVGDLFSLHNPL